MILGTAIHLIELDIITFLAIAGILLMLGKFLVSRLNFLRKFAIPSPVVGGFLFAILTLISHQMNFVEFTMDNTLSDLFMYIFFVTIGLSSSLRLITQGGKFLIIYMLFCWALALIQNIVEASVASIMGIDPLLGLMASQPALQGGHGMSASMAPVIDALGTEGALNVGLAAATYGLIAGSLLGGPVGSFLIEKFNIPIQTQGFNEESEIDEDKSKHQEYANTEEILLATVMIFFVLAIGFPIADWITHSSGFAIPGHIFSLFIGILLRSFLEVVPIIEIPQQAIETISTVSLELFLVMAMMSLKIWELSELALPLIILLLVQTIVIVIIAGVFLFKALGSDYDAANMSGAYIGHGLGATPNGLMIIDALANKYGVRSIKAFIFIPIAGTVLADIVGVPLFIFVANLLK